jgi:hypothetical protein
MKEPVMPKYLRTFLAAVAAASTAGASAASVPADWAFYPGFVSVGGDWTVHLEYRLSGPPVTVGYECVRGGKAVIEHQAPSGSLPVVTVYFLADGKLRATQYSPAGNQPAFKRGGKSTAELLELAFDGGTGFDPDHDGHVRRGEIRFVSPDRIEQRWFHHVGPKEQGATHWFLERNGAESPPEAAPATKPAEPEAEPQAAGNRQ